MKTLIICVLYCFSMLFLANSCKDSLGYDPNVEITLIEKDTSSKNNDGGNGNNGGNGSSTISPIKIDTSRCRFDFIETFRMPVDQDMPEGRIEFEKLNITLDTNNGKMKLNFSMLAENHLPQNRAPRHKDDDRFFLVGLEFSDYIDDIRNRFDLNDISSTGSKWFELNLIKFSPDNREHHIILNGSDLNSQLIIFNIDKKQGVIQGAVTADLVKYSNIKLRSFRINFALKYK